MNGLIGIKNPLLLQLFEQSLEFLGELHYQSADDGAWIPLVVLQHPRRVGILEDKIEGEQECH